MAVEIEKISLPTIPEISQAEILIGAPGDRTKCRGALVLCPGQNGSSEEMVQNVIWQKFAEREALALVGFRFVSLDKDLQNGRGYFQAARGSGLLLEAGLKRAGLEGVPLLLYGFSGGAHFAMSFAAWKPDRVRAFCAYSFAWWDQPPKKLNCPALIVCGQADGLRYGSSLAYFQAGRKMGKPWTWVSLQDTPHAPNADLDDFVRDYFSCVLNGGKTITPTSTQTGLSLPIRAAAVTDAQQQPGFQSQRIVEEEIFDCLPISEPVGISRRKADKLLVDNMTTKKVRERAKDDVSTSVLPCLDLWPKWQAIHYP